MKIFFISQRHTKDKHGTWTDSLENTYTEYFSKFGIVLFPVSNVCNDISKLFEKFKPAGIILSGGGDVNPELYNENAKENLSISKYRDVTERELLKQAIELKIPVLGICRGMQFINVYFGGRLTRDINSIDVYQIHKTPCTHEITITDLNFATRLNIKNKYTVNSYHNHGIFKEMLSLNLKAFAAFDELNIIEGLYHPSLPIIGIQWHPERQNEISDIDKMIIDLFLKGF